jgi:hypothetical protein
MSEHETKPQAGPRYYGPAANPDGAALPGIPLADLRAKEFQALPEWQQRSIDASGLWTTEAPREPDAGAASEQATEARTAGSNAPPPPADESTPRKPGKKE